MNERTVGRPGRAADGGGAIERLAVKGNGGDGEDRDAEWTGLSLEEQRTLAGVRPGSATALHGWLKAMLGIHVPHRPMCTGLGHEGPMAYLEHVFFERPGDVLVWANRGGGKTFYGAVATLLDLLFKPGVEVRILGGSLDQSRRMYEHLRWMLDRPALRDRIAGKMTERGVRLTNGSRVELLAQAETSVRGQRVQKLRCDEVELFDRDVWAAAQFTTRSARCEAMDVRGGVEVLSTMHRPFGLMSELVEAAQADPAWRMVRWCALDVMDTCEPDRECEGCPLWEPCGGRAKRRRGFLAVADVLDQRRRSSAAAFEAEMLCRRPSRTDAVFPAFDPAVHVRALEPDASLRWVGGMDFGLRHPFVMLWAQLRELPGSRVRIEVLDEYVRPDRTLAEHVAELDRRGWPRPQWVGVDPAGHQRSSQTGRSAVAVLQEAGYAVRSARVPLADGLEAVRRRIEGAGERGGLTHDGSGAEDPGGDNPDPERAGREDREAEPGLLVHPRCKRLIESLTCYHFDVDRPDRQEPVKDGYDHPADALRYLVVNLERGAGRLRVRSY